MAIEQIAAKTGIDVGLGASLLALVTFAQVEAALQFLVLLIGALLGIGRLWLMYKEIRDRSRKRNRRASDRKDE
jgi:hypothetical protein